MKEQYRKKCILETPLYSVVHGIGIYRSCECMDRMHYDATLSLTYIKAGSGQIKINGRCYGFGCGDLIMMNPSEIHCTAMEEGCFHERVSVCINAAAFLAAVGESEAIFDCFYARTQENANVIPAEIAERYGLGRLAEDLLSFALQGGEHASLLCFCRLSELLVRLGESTATPAERHFHENPTVREALRYIDTHFAEIENCDRVARELFIGKFHLEHLFLEYVGMSLWNYVILRRLIYANHLLQKGHSVKEAAERAGFHNYANFFRLYKKHMGTTPSAYKNAQKT